MKITRINLVIVSCLAFASQSMAASFGTGFVYQGRLLSGTNPANGIYDLKFSLFDASSGGSQIGNSQTNSSVTVTNGLITATLDFGAGALDGSARWLEVGVRSNLVASFSTLSPRQPLTPAPYSLTASNLAGNLPVTQLTGTLSSGQLGGTYSGALNLNNPANIFFGNGGGLTNVDANTFGGFGVCNLPCYWKLTGNSGTTPGPNFLGTTDNKALELKVNNNRALRLEPNSTSPNIIGGFLGNYVNAVSYGSTIAGGGATLMTNLIDVFQDGFPPTDYVPVFGTISGGISNQIYGNGFSFIGGGASNVIVGRFDVGDNAIAGGAGNTIQHATGSSIAGGEGNSIASEFNNVTFNGTIGGGKSNVITEGAGNNSKNVTIAGGNGNRIEGSRSASIGGGTSNRVFWGDSATIGGGSGNLAFLIGGSGATVGGGIQNQIYDYQSSGATISGGSNNFIGVNSTRGCFVGTISGGANNSITSSDTSVIGGGKNNIISGTDGIDGNTIGGGTSNYVYEGYLGTTIAGGSWNSIHGNYFTTIGGGSGNFISVIADGSVIAGGVSNFVESSSLQASVGGGYSNVVNATYAAIPGGALALAKNYGQMAHANGMFASAGDAQTSEYVSRNTTTNATQTDLFLDGITKRIVVPVNSTWTFDVLISARASGGNSAAYRIFGAIKNNAGTTTLLGILNKTIIGEDISTWDANIVADDPTDSLVVRVTGASATTIRWVATVRTTEVNF